MDVLQSSQFVSGSSSSHTNVNNIAFEIKLHAHDVGNTVAFHVFLGPFSPLVDHEEYLSLATYYSASTTLSLCSFHSRWQYLRHVVIY
jgi:hypothetical protein